MKEQDLLSAVREDPEYVTPFFALADWYEQHNQNNRADWIRACCRKSMTSHDSPIHRDAKEQIEALWPICKPLYWHHLDTQHMNLRCVNGMFHAILFDEANTVNPEDIRKLGSQRWLREAFEEGYLDRIELGWDDGSLLPIILDWDLSLMEIPICVGVAAKTTRDFLNALSLPQLRGLSVHFITIDSMPKAVMRIGELIDLRFLTLSLRFFDNGIWKELLEQVLLLRNLSYLTLHGEYIPDYGIRPNDEDLLRLVSISNLKKLEICDAAGISDVGLSHAQSLRPDLRIYVK